MIEVLTSTGVFLDLDPNTEFEITIENPMLDDDRTPAPWSTDIAFAPTAKNKRAFGWIDALFLEPSVREIGATIIAHGIHLWTGTLVYDGISDGKANYTFSGLDYSEEWSKKLYQLPFLGDEVSGVRYMKNVIAGTVDGVKAPIVVNRALVADSAFAIVEGYRYPTFNTNRKYRNTYDCNVPANGFIAAVTVQKILSQALGDKLDISHRVKDLFNSLAVFGTMWSSYLPVTGSGEYSLNVFDSFPDVELSEFIKDICRMTCSAIYSYRGRFYIVGFEDIISESSPVVWDDKISDTFEVSGIDKQGYSLSFSDSSGTSLTGTEEAEYQVDNLSGIEDIASGEYYVVAHNRSGDVYSVKRAMYRESSATTPVCVEWMSDKLGGQAAYETGGDDKYDSSVGLKIAVCTPIMARRGVLEESSYYEGMAPVIDIPGVGDSRPTTAYVAVLGQAQATDNGYVMTMDGSAFGAGHGDDVNLGYSLNPEWLFKRYHQYFASWLARDRSMVKVDVALSVYELAALKIWSKVSIYGQTYIISKISVRMSAKIGSTLTVNCELISF